MISEDYISFEVARLLKEKGFNERTYGVYDSKGGFSSNNPDIYWNEKNIPFISAPTHQMTMKWLREVYDIFIEISVDEMLKDEGYQWTLYYNTTKEIRPYSGWEDSYENAVEAAIKYCLTNLI